MTSVENLSSTCPQRVSSTSTHVINLDLQSTNKILAGVTIAFTKTVTDKKREYEEIAESLGIHWVA